MDLQVHPLLFEDLVDKVTTTSETTADVMIKPDQTSKVGGLTTIPVEHISLPEADNVYVGSRLGHDGKLYDAGFFFEKHGPGGIIQAGSSDEMISFLRRLKLKKPPIAPDESVLETFTIDGDFTDPADEA